MFKLLVNCMEKIFITGKFKLLNPFNELINLNGLNIIKL